MSLKSINISPSSIKWSWPPVLLDENGKYLTTNSVVPSAGALFKFIPNKSISTVPAKVCLALAISSTSSLIKSGASLDISNILYLASCSIKLLELAPFFSIKKSRSYLDWS